MADPTDQDITDSLNNAQNLTDQVVAADTVLGKLLDKVEDISKEFINAFTGSSVDAVKNYNSLLGTVGDVYDKVSAKAKSAGMNFQVSMDGGGAAIRNLTDPLDRLTTRLIRASTIAPFSPMFDSLKDGSGIVGAAINETQDFTGVIDSLGKLGGRTGETIAQALGKLPVAFIANANQAEKFEQSFIALSSAAGDMNSLFGRQGGLLVDLSAKTQNYANQVSAAAEVTGLSVKQSLSFAGALKAIPGVMDQMIRTGTGANDSTTSLIGSMRVMTGLGISQGEVIKGLTTAYEDLSGASGKVTDSAQRGAEFLADVSSVANTLGLRFDDVRGVMEKIADEFKFVGNQSDDAAKMLDRYSRALQETGLTGKASLSIVGSLTENINRMTIGTKAFLSLRTGGPGGLQGAFQIEQLLRQGRIDQVARMAEGALRQQFGGRIFTQAEAAQSPEAAAQFMRQRQLLQSGAFGIGQGLGNDQATRLLEALGKQDFGAVSETLKTGQDAVKQATDRGTQIQERNNTELKTIARTTERAAIAAEIQAGVLMRQLFGAAGPMGAPTARGDAIRQTRTRAETQAFEAGRRSPEATTAEAFIKEQALLARQTFGEAFTALEGVGSGLKEGAIGVGENIAGFGQDMKEILGEKLDKASADADQALGQRPRAPAQAPDRRNMRDMTRGAIPAAQRRAEVLTAATRAGGPEQDLRSVVADLVRASKEPQKVEVEVAPPPPQKVVLEIMAPAGFGARTRGTNENVLVKINSASVVPDVDKGAGY